MFNKASYESNDYIATISKVTSDIVQKVAPSVKEEYIPHAVDGTVFKKLSQAEVSPFYEQTIPGKDFVCFWNNRNARRKQSGTLVYWWKDFLDQPHVDESKCSFIMHTALDDPHGQPLHHLAEMCELNIEHPNQILFSTQKVMPNQLAVLYNCADCTINIADAEGFGLATLESLSCETPIIVTMTGGLQEQVTNGEDWFGVGLEPASKVIIGSQAVPYIHEDRVSKKDFLDALNKMYKMSPEEREELGRRGRQHVDTNYNFEKFGQQWVDFMTRVHEESGSWETRKNYKSWKWKTL
jgi:glycosyltransferase involved in cell wall biosynthesis